VLGLLQEKLTPLCLRLWVRLDRAVMRHKVVNFNRGFISIKHRAAFQTRALSRGGDPSNFLSPNFRTRVFAHFELSLVFYEIVYDIFEVFSLLFRVTLAKAKVLKI